MFDFLRTLSRSISRRWSLHRHGDNAAALAFYTLISLVPMLLVGILTAGIFLGPRVAEGELQSRIDHLMGEEAASFINRLLEQASTIASNPGLGFIISLGILLFTGSLVLAQLRHTLSRIFLGAPAEQAPSFLTGLAARGIATLVIIAFGFLLIASTLLNTFISSYANQIEFGLLKNLELVNKLQILSNFLLLVALFTLLLKALPRNRPSLLPAFVGASIGAILTSSLKWAMELQLRHGNLSSLYGSTVSIFVFFFWIYFSMHAFLLGAEIAAIMEERRNDRKKCRQKTDESNSPAENSDSAKANT